MVVDSTIKSRITTPVHLCQGRYLRIHQTNSLEKYENVEQYGKSRFKGHNIFQFTDEIREAIKVSNQQGSPPFVLEVCLALHFYVSGSFQDVCGIMFIKQVLVELFYRRHFCAACSPKQLSWCLLYL